MLIKKYCENVDFDIINAYIYDTVCVCVCVKTTVLFPFHSIKLEVINILFFLVLLSFNEQFISPVRKNTKIMSDGL